MTALCSHGDSDICGSRRHLDAIVAVAALAGIRAEPHRHVENPQAVPGTLRMPLRAREAKVADMATAAPPYAAPADQVARQLGLGDLQAGLTTAGAEARRAAYGLNVLPEARRPAYIAIAARQLFDPLVALLVGAAIVSAVIGEQLEAGVIGAIVALNAVLGFVQEAGAERAVLALRGMVSAEATVVRDGAERRVPAADVVPGDLAVLREGDRVPADARVLDEAGLEVDESALTGESVPVEKRPAPVAPGTALAERACMVFAGTGVTRGQSRALVTATGQTTEMAAVARLTAVAKPPPTPLQRRLGRLSRLMVALGIAVTAALTAGMLARGATLEEAFLVGVSVAVAAVPEGLAATVTIALAQGAREMASRGAIVRRLAAVETLGGASVIAADKTGTLTLNQLRVVEVHPLDGHSSEEVLEVGALASAAQMLADGKPVGDPVDVAFLLALRPDPRSATGRRLVREVPFDPWRKRLTRVYESERGLQAVVKGAPEVLAERAELTPAERDAVLAQATAWAADGLRVLAVGQHAVTEDVDDDMLDDGLDLVGLVGIRDPLRETAADAVRAAKRAGIDVAMLTGDHPVTAAAIARRLDLDGDRLLSGPELSAYGPDELPVAVAGCSVFARVTPAEKLRLVEALQRAGHVVAVTGDGINDTPALRRADVGVAMGRGGTQAAREAADIVLTDDDFATIVDAIREGRRIDDNVRTFVAFLLSANLGEVLLFGVAVLAGIGVPMTVVQVLTINLLTDGAPAVALSRDAASAHTMERGPRRGTSLFARPLRGSLLLAGTAVGLAATAAYLLGRELAPAAAQTMAFATIALAELVYVFSIRTPMLPAWRGPRNRVLVASVVLSAAVLLLTIYLPALQGSFGTEPLGALELAAVALLAAVPAALNELVKGLRRRR